MQTRKLSPIVPALILAAVLHGLFAWHYRTLRPELGAIDPPPSPLAREALSFGDHQFIYRYWALDLQNAGDTGGRATPMRDYNYDNVYAWLAALQSLDYRAQNHVFLATRYFSQTPDVIRLRRLVAFIYTDAVKDPEDKWYWLTQAIEMADHRLGDLPYALEMSRKLAGYDFYGLPTWTWLFPAVVLEKMGRFDEARQVIEGVRREKAGRLEKETLNWMKDFEGRLGKS